MIRTLNEDIECNDWERAVIDFYLFYFHAFTQSICVGCEGVLGELTRADRVCVAATALCLVRSLWRSVCT